MLPQKHTHITQSIYTCIHFFTTSQSPNQSIGNGFASISSSHAYTHTSLFTKNKQASNAHTHNLMQEEREASKQWVQLTCTHTTQAHSFPTHTSNVILSTNPQANASKNGA